MTASPSVTSRINAMRAKLAKSRICTTDGLRKFNESTSHVNINITPPSASLRAMLAEIKLGQETYRPTSGFADIHHSKIPRTT